MRVGIAGTGRMGAAIAGKLLEDGVDVIIWNRTRDKIAPLLKIGAQPADSPEDLAVQADAIITILTNAAAIDEVYHANRGLLSANVRGKVFIEMSSVEPDTERTLAQAVNDAGGAFLECPVSGSTGPARNGTLLGLAGGSAEALAKARPILDRICRRVEHCGPVGAGTTMKLAVNTPLSIYFQALGEALAVARSASIEPQRLLEIFAESSGGANVLKTRAPMIADVLAGGLLREATGFDLDSARKDVRTILAEAKRRGLEMPLLERTLEEFNEASQRGWGPRDTWAHAVYWALGRRPIEPGSEPIRVADDAVSDHTHG